MGVFGAFFGRRGVVGFSGALFGVSSGVVGFIVAMFLRAAREKVRPAHEKWPKIGVFWRAGRSFSRKCRWRPAAGRVFSRTGSRGPGCWALLLAVLSLRCAAKPHRRHGGQAAQATHRVNVRVDAGVPWRYVVCCGPAVARERRRQARRSPGAFHGSSDTTEAGPRRVPPLVACGGRRTVSARASARRQRPRSRQARSAQFFHQPLTVSMACVPRSDSAEWALTRPEDRRAAWKREATFSQFTTFHQALT